MSTKPEKARRRSRRIARLGAAAALLAGGALASSPPALADGPQTLYVGQGGADTAQCGPADLPCASIQFAIDNSQPGDTVLVAPGTYNEDVHIDHALTLRSDGTGLTIIDGTGQTQTAPRSGVIWIGNQGGGALGDVTVSGFTVTNPTAFPGSDGVPESVVLQDSNADDMITISDNAITGWHGDPNAANDGQIGVYTQGNDADTVVRGNDISGVFEGAEFNDNGPLTFSGNTVHDVGTRDDGTGHVYPGQGVLVLSDSAGALNQQNLDDNTFKGYFGSGIEYAAEFDDGDCSSTPCSGSITGQATYNTFDLTADPDATVNEPAAGIVLKTENVGNVLDLDLSGNHGTVSDALGTITEDPDAGTIALHGQANEIAPYHVITAGSTIPEPIVIGAAPVEFTQLAISHSSADLDNARYDYIITGSSSLHADQLKLEYYDEESSSWKPISLVDSPIGIIGYLGPEGGFTFPAGASLPTKLRISASSSAPTGGVQFDTRLDQVSIDAGHIPINPATSRSTQCQRAAATAGWSRRRPCRSRSRPLTRPVRRCPRPS